MAPVHTGRRTLRCSFGATSPPKQDGTLGVRPRLPDPCDRAARDVRTNGPMRWACESSLTSPESHRLAARGSTTEATFAGLVLVEIHQLVELVEAHEPIEIVA